MSPESRVSRWVAFHALVTRWLPVKVKVSVHELLAAPRLVTPTFAVKPLPH